MEVHKQPSEDNLGGEVFLEMRLLIADVILIRKGAAKVWQADYRFEFFQASKGKPELQV